jgi:hypothetical protein
MGYCGKCGKKWNGLSECHCSACHEQFGSVFAFDKHRTGKKEDRRCMEIEEMFDKKMYFDTETRKWVSGRQPDSRIFPLQQSKTTSKAKT